MKGRQHLHKIRILKGGHPTEEHGCTESCLQSAGTIEYICEVHGETVYGESGACSKCLAGKPDARGSVQKVIAS